MSALDPPEDYIRLWPALRSEGVEVALEVEVHGAYVYGRGGCRYEPRNQRSAPVKAAMRLAYELVAAYRRQQQEGKA